MALAKAAMGSSRSSGKTGNGGNQSDTDADQRRLFRR